MKLNILSFALIFAALLIGIFIGYLLFNASNGASDSTPPKSSVQAPEEESIWTCSMHPQIRQNEPGICPICEMDLIPLTTNSSNDPLVLEMTEAAVRLAQVETTTVGLDQVEGIATSILTGKVQADERLASTQVAHIPGRIEKLRVTFTGEEVKEGQVLATLYAPELITAQQELLEAKKLINVNPDLIVAARNKLRYWKIPDETIESMEAKDEIQETFELQADASGVVTNRRVAVGDYVRQGEPLFDLMNLNKVWVLFDAYEEDLATLSIGDRIEFTTPSLPGRSFRTKITFIDPVINPETRVASLRAEISNPRGRLKPAMFVRGKVIKNPKSNVQLMIPKSSVLWTGRRSVVYVQLPDRSIPSYQYREVVLGESIGNNYIVLEGLEPGEEIVTHGNFAIDAAAQLNNQASMMNKQVLLKGTEPGSEIPNLSNTTPETFKQQLQVLTEAYLAVKDALVETDAMQAQDAARQMNERIREVDMELLSGEAHDYWMEQFSAIQAHGGRIINASEIEEQRTQFDFLSQAMIQSLKAFGVSSDTFYVQHCPMAFDNAGAEWISSIKEIRNPYFGDKMLKCGLVQDSIGQFTADRADSGTGRHSH